MKYTLIILFFSPLLLIAQEESAEEKRLSLLIGTSQGVSFMYKEALSNTVDKTFKTTAGYAFSYGGGISITSKSKKAFSEIIAHYRSYNNGIKEVVDINSGSGYSSKMSYNRFNYFALEYQYSRYIKTIKDFNSFFSVGVQTSYILNEKKKLNYENSSEVIKIEGKNFSNNFFILTSPTFILSYGTEFNKGIMNIGEKSRVSINFTYDIFLNIESSPSNQYLSTMISYRLLL
jgi:hypothetical protein